MTTPLNELIDEMFRKRAEKQKHEAHIKQINEQITSLQLQLITRLREVGTDYARGTLASATLTETVLPKIDNWGLVADWVMQNNALYLLHRRVSSGPWKELRDAGTDVPGIEPFTNTSISLRKLGD